MPQQLILAFARKTVRHTSEICPKTCQEKNRRESRPETNVKLSRVILVDRDPAFVLFRLAGTFGLPALPEWTPFLFSQLQRRRRIETLVALAVHPLP